MFKLYLGTLMTACGLYCCTKDTFYCYIITIAGGYILIEWLINGIQRKNKNSD